MATRTLEEHAYLLVLAATRTPFDHARKRKPGWEWSVNFIGNAFGPVVWQTREQAEWHIKELLRLDTVNVEHGFYSIDGPNEEGNEFVHCMKRIRI